MDETSSSGSSWPTHLIERRWHPLQTGSDESVKVQRILRLRHSQQLRVPLRTFLIFLGDGVGSADQPTTGGGSIGDGRSP